MPFGAGADFQDAVRKQVARLLQIEDIVEEHTGEEIDREESERILNLYRKYDRFTPDKDYRMQAYKEV